VAIDLEELGAALVLRRADGSLRIAADDYSRDADVQFDGDCSESIDLDSLVADAGVAPQAWQSRAPDSVYTGVKPPIGWSPDLDRIMALKRRPQLDPDSERATRLVQLMTERYRRPRTTPCRCREIDPRRFKDNPNACITELNVAQAWTLFEAGIVQGWTGAIGVGHGKTILDILGALALCDAWAHHRQRRGEPVDREKFTVLLLVIPGLIDQLWTEYQLVAEHFRVPWIVFHSRNRKAEVPGEPHVHVMSFHQLSQPRSTTFIRGLAPDAFIVDESQNVGNVESTRGSRVWLYVQDVPRTRMGHHTGSMTDSSIMDFLALCSMSLKDGSPLPRDVEVGRSWASCLDPDDQWRADPGELMERLIATGCCEPGEHVYKGWHRRLVETMGFVATRDSAIKAALEIDERELDIPEILGDRVPNAPRQDETAPDGCWPGVADCLASIRDGVRPDGEELLEDGAFTIARHLDEMACGFFNRWVFDEVPQHDPLVKHWRETRKNYRKAVREALKPRNRREHLDSPFLLKMAAMRHFGDVPKREVIQVIDEETGELRTVDTGELPEWDSEGTWPHWRDAEHTVKYHTEPVWVDEFLALDAAQWAREHRGIVWVTHRAFARAVAKLGKLRLHGGGPEAPARLIGGEYRGRVYPGETGEESIVCSVKAHGVGRNGLQFLFDEALAANPPASNEGWEQMLGRLHRIGQRSPVVRTWFYRHTAEGRKHVQTALRRALYVATTIGATQKLRVGFKLHGDDGLYDLK
jgi:hypothetical protein